VKTVTAYPLSHPCRACAAAAGRGGHSLEHRLCRDGNC
jgi:hypothetical protein